MSDYLLFVLTMIALLGMFCLAETCQAKRHQEQMDKLRRIETLIRCKIGFDNPEDLEIFELAEKQSELLRKGKVQK
jgi:hypothetical protein